MFNHLFINTLNALVSELQTSTVHLLANHKKPSDKFESLLVNLLNFKCELFKNILQFIRSIQSKQSNKGDNQTNVTLLELQREIQANNQNLFRHRLHKILKKKAYKKRKQSVLLEPPHQQSQKELSELQKSIVLLERDLGIESEDNSQLAVTKIINRSLFLGIDSTPISKIKEDEYSITSDLGSASIDFSKDSQLSFNLKSKQNQQSNGISFEIQQKSTPVVKKIIPAKKKRISVNKPDVREDLLGNLLQETYNQILDKK